jgi:DNA-binding response OmpR family regulator
MAEQPASVLVVDDEEEIVGLMRDFLEAAGYVVFSAHDGPSALEVLGRERIDCLLLDIMMPGESGFEVLRHLRETSDVPVLVLSARHADSDKLRGLGLGADDYIVKSATPSEVVARVRAVLRRVRRDEGPAPAILDFGRLRIDPRAHEVWVDGEPTPFTPREFELLMLLAEHPRQVVSRDQIYERLWGEFGDRHTLTVHIGRIREKIEADPSEPRYIVTVWGIGYRFEGERR